MSTLHDINLLKYFAVTNKCFQKHSFGCYEVFYDEPENLNESFSISVSIQHKQLLRLYG